MDSAYTKFPPASLGVGEVVLGLLNDLAVLAVEQARFAAQRSQEKRRPGRGGTLRPGAETPLWSAVLEKVRPHLQTRGAKASLARVLELPRQRIHEYFVTRTQMPDAERMLHVLLWLAAREATDETSGVTKSPKPLH